MSFTLNGMTVHSLYEWAVFKLRQRQFDEQLIDPLTDGDTHMSNSERKQVFEKELKGGSMVME